MTKDQVTVGGEYIAMVSDKLVTVRVDRIYSANRFNKKDSTCYDVTNLATGRKLTFKSAGKFRRLASEAPKGREKVNRTSSGGFPEDGGTGGGPSFLPEIPVALKAPTDTAIAPEAGNGSKPVPENKTVPSPSPVATEAPTSKAAYPANPIPLSQRLALANAVPGEKKPTEEQNQILAAAAKRPKVLVVTAGAGTGKCLGRGTPVLMYDGCIKSVEDVEEGDQLMGPDSKPRKVLSTSIGRGLMYLIKPTSGDYWECNADHVLTLMGTNHVMGQVRDVSVREYLREAEEVVPHCESWKLFRVGVEFEAAAEQLPIPPYLVGLWMGDGSKNSPTITNSKGIVREYCQLAAAQMGLICKVRPDNNTFTLDFVACNKGDKGQVTGNNKFRTFILKECMVNSLKRIPQVYLTASRKDRELLLAGIIDTDGETTGNSNTFISVTGEPYRDGLLFLARSLGLAAYQIAEDTHVCANGRVSHYYSISLSGDLDKLPTVVRRFPPRKQIKRVLVTGFEVFEQAEDDYFGFTLDGDGRFLLGDFTVTHNTTTLRMLADNLKGNGQYTAFNTNLVNESKSKFEGTRVACNTTHSLAFRAVGKNYSHRLGGQRVKSYQIAQILGIKDFEVTIGEETKSVEGKEVKKPITKRLSAGYLAGQVMGAVSRFCQSAETEVQASHFRYIDGIDVPSPTGRTYVNNEKVRAYLLPFAEAAWKDLSNPEGSLPFAHDHYVKVWQLSKPVIAGDYILLDEAQDTAPVMLDVIRRQKSPVIIVGDSAQQIYEWRGAVDALESFPGAPISYLSQSFRFGEAIADVANAILERIVGIELRLKGFPAIPSRVAEVASPTCILCRTNAVAVASLLEALANGKKPFLVGGGAAVVSFVEAAESLQRGESTNHPDLACFSSWLEVQEYAKNDPGGEDLQLMVKLVDTFGCSKILEALKAMPAEKEADLVISTAHKSKGREWDSVRLANDFPTASKSSDSDLKLLYVAVTRAKLILDVSQCPFFTGQDSMDVSEIAARIPKTGEESVLPPTPSAPPAPTEFTWAKDDQTGTWLVKGASGKKGEVVKVVRRDGSESTRRLIDVARQIGPVSFYRV